MKRWNFLPLVVLSAVLGLSSAGFGVSRNAPARHELDVTLPQMKFTNVALGDVIDFVRDVSGANIHVAWRALEEAGVTKDTNVNVNLRAVSMRKALDLVLGDAAGGNTLTYYVDQNVIEITTRQLADAKMITRIYPVQDLIMEIPDFTAPDIDLASATDQTNTSGGSGNSSSSGNSGGASGSGLFPSNSNNTDKSQVASKKDRADQLVQLIMDIIRPDIWQPNGGPASIRFYNGNLIVTAPRSVQEAIGGPID
jgi:hypothetical protein